MSLKRTLCYVAMEPHDLSSFFAVNGSKKELRLFMVCSALTGERPIRYRVAWNKLTNGSKESEAPKPRATDGPPISGDPERLRGKVMFRIGHKPSDIGR